MTSRLGYALTNIKPVAVSGFSSLEAPRVRKFADDVIEAQEREIAEMKYLTADLEARD